MEGKNSRWPPILQGLQLPSSHFLAFFLLFDRCFWRCVPNRFVGQWLSDTNQEWPEHELIAPTAEAMTLEIYYSVLHNLFVQTTPCIILSNLDLLRNLLSTNMLLVESSPRYLCPGIGAAVSIYRIPTFVTGFCT